MAVTLHVHLFSNFHGIVKEVQVQCEQASSSSLCVTNIATVAWFCGLSASMFLTRWWGAGSAPPRHNAASAFVAAAAPLPPQNTRVNKRAINLYACTMAPCWRTLSPAKATH